MASRLGAAPLLAAVVAVAVSIALFLGTVWLSSRRARTAFADTYARVAGRV